MLTPADIEHKLGERAAAHGVLVALSGGLDSTVLLDLLRRTDLEVAAVHIDHQLRPSSTEDAAFCRRLAATWGVPLVVEPLDVAHRGSTQENARIQRYAAIARVAQRLGLDTVVTAHHADDALETALLNFRRGTSARGLSALVAPTRAPIPSWPDLELVRPLASTSRDQIRAYAAQQGLDWHVDPTNEECDYQRNRLRHDVLPGLTADGAYLAPMLETLQNLASEAQTLEAIASHHFDRALLRRPDHESLALACETLADAPEALVIQVLQRAADELPAEVGLGRDHLQRAARAVHSGKRVELAVRRAVLTVDRRFLTLEVARARGGKQLHARTAAPIALQFDSREGRLPWFGSQLVYRTLAGRPATRGLSTAYLPASGEAKNLVVRGPCAGDKLDARAMRGRKSVADILAEAGVPRHFRWRWPCVVRSNTDEVVWVCGLRRSAATDAAADEGPVVELLWEFEPYSVFGKIVDRQKNRADLQYS